jgi:glutamyl-tRNA synthetase
MPQKIITRFPPSPTGFLHIGSLRTALYNFLFARANQGKFYLRIEDTDQKRLVTGATENLITILKQFGLDWDNKKILIQSERLDIYQNFAAQLVQEGKAYFCFCDSRRLENLRLERQQKKLPPMYDGKCRNLSEAEIKSNIEANKPCVIRFKMPQTGTTEFNDLIRGKISFNNSLLDDQIILKSDCFPTYHLAAIVDDHEMQISHVIRGEEWLPSTPKHILIYQAFGWEIPEFAHLPLLVNSDHTKMSKRQGDVAVEDYLKKGYLIEALINFVLLLGWNPGTDQEIFSLTEMIEKFDLKKVHKSAAVFDLKKLDWLNGEYLKKMDFKKFANQAADYLRANFPQLPDNLDQDKIFALEKNRISHFSQMGQGIEFLFTETLSYQPELLVWKKSTPKTIFANLEILTTELEKYSDKEWSADNLQEKISDFIIKNKKTNGEILWPMRVALTGLEKSPTPFEIAEILGPKKSILRLKDATKKLANLL